MQIKTRVSGILSWVAIEYSVMRLPSNLVISVHFRLRFRLNEKPDFEIYQQIFTLPHISNMRDVM